MLINSCLRYFSAIGMKTGVWEGDMNLKNQSKRIFAAVTALASIGFLSLSAQDNQSRLQELQSQLQEYELRLQEVQQQAMAEGEVQDARDNFSDTLDSAMVAVDPNAEEFQERKDELYSELVDMGPYDALSEDDQANYQTMVQEYQQVDSQLQTLADQAMSEAEVQAARAEFQETLISHMREIDSGIDDLLDAREEAYREFQELQQGMTQPMGPQGG